MMSTVRRKICNVDNEIVGAANTQDRFTMFSYYESVIHMTLEESAHIERRSGKAEHER